MGRHRGPALGSAGVGLAVLAGVLAAVGGPVLGPSRSPASALPGACPGSDGVTVVVDFADLGGGTLVACAPSPVSSGLAALGSAGIDWQPTARFAQFVCRIEGLPADDPCVNTPPASAYWTYWVASRGGPWCYSSTGAGSRVPPPGSVEGWSFAKDRPAAALPPPRIAAPAPAPGSDPPSSPSCPRPAPATTAPATTAPAAPSATAPSAAPGAAAPGAAVPTPAGSGTSPSGHTPSPAPGPQAGLGPTTSPGPGPTTTELPGGTAPAATSPGVDAVGAAQGAASEGPASEGPTSGNPPLRMAGLVGAVMAVAGAGTLAASRRSRRSQAQR